MRMSVCLTTLAVVLFGSISQAEEPKPAITFDGEVKGILNKRCAKCHTGDRPRGDLDLSSYGAVLQGGSSGKAVESGKPENSPLYTTTAHLEDPKMPPNSPKIPQTELDTLRIWIEGGLVEKVATKATTIAPKASIPAKTTASIGGLLTATTLERPTAITALSVNPKGDILAVSGRKQVLLYDTAFAKLLGALAFPEGEVQILRFSRDGKTLLAAGGRGGQSGVIVGFEVSTWKRTFTIMDNTDAILAADLSSDGKLVAFGGPSRLVKIAATTDGKILHTFRKPTDWVMSVAFSPDGLLIAAGDRFGGLNVWETQSGKEFYQLRGHTKSVRALAWRGDGEALASISEDETVRLWNLHTGKEVAQWNAHAEGGLDLAWLGDGTLLSAGRDKLAKLWKADGQRLREFGPQPDMVMKLTTAGAAVFTGDWSGQVRRWSTSGGAATAFNLPIQPKKSSTTLVAVPLPELTPVAISEPKVESKPVATATEFQRKQAALKSLEEAAEKLKEEAARSPKNLALAKAYLQVCEAVLAMKIEVVEAEANLKK